MNIGVFGANGSIGQRIVKEALSRDHTVTALARETSRIGAEQDGVVWKVADILDAESIGKVIGSVDVLVSSYGPGPRSDASGNYIPASVAAAVNEAATTYPPRWRPRSTRPSRWWSLPGHYSRRSNSDRRCA